MRRLTILCAGVMGMALASLAGGTPALAGTFVYVSNAEDGDISTFTLKPDGELQAGDACQGGQRRHAHGGQSGSPLPLRGVALQAVLGARRMRSIRRPAG